MTVTVRHRDFDFTIGRDADDFVATKKAAVEGRSKRP